MGVTYDTGALIAAERDDHRMGALHSGFIQGDEVLVVPAPVLAEAWRGGPRQALLVRLLASCEVEPMTEEQARAVGELAGMAGHADVVDVTVVEGAIRRGDSVVTSDPAHIQRIAGAAGGRLVIDAV